MNKKQEKHTSKGITLIALVITIIVMLILVAVTIQIAVNGGLFEYAGKASGDTKNAIDEENNLATGSVIDKYLYDLNEDVAKLPTYSENLLDITTGILKENTKYISDGKVAVIPKGFKIIEDMEGKKSIDSGLVIQDSERNEFVWVPVTVEGTTDTEKEANFEKIRTTNNNQNYSEPFTSGYTDGKGTEETKDYREMRASVIKNGGFYIGRYEAGVEGDTARTDIENGISKMVVQRDKFPYNNVGWGSSMSDYEADVTDESKNQGKGALYLSKHMYDGKDVGVISTLCYGVQWDATLAFIGDENYYKNSTTKGNYKNNAWTITRETAKYTASPESDTTWTSISSETNKTKTKTASESILLTTGASEDFKTKNIYDLAGNVYEWTNEARSTTYRVSRGGHYNGANRPASSHGFNYPNNCHCSIGFRPVLYIK